MNDSITLTRTEYQDLIDARDHAQAMRDIVGGVAETFSEAEAEAYLAAPSPLAFWRKHRGMTQTSLAKAAGITQPYLAQIERGLRNADVKLYVKFARTLKTRVDDIVPAD